MSIPDNVRTFTPRHPRIFVSRIDTKEDLEHIVDVLSTESPTFVGLLENVDATNLRVSETDVYVPGELTRFGKNQSLFSVGDYFVGSENGFRLVTSNEAVYYGNMETVLPQLLEPVYDLIDTDVPAKA